MVGKGMKVRQRRLLMAGLWLVGTTTAAALAVRLGWMVVQPRAALALTTASRLFATAQSPGAVAVGAAEGNLTPTGAITALYYGHIDPGNHVTNRGFCSWNGAAQMTVDQANERCLLALQQHAATTEQQLRELGLKPSSEPAAVVNGTDLWNQSDQAGPQFAAKYQQALARGLSGRKALVTARVEAFRDFSGQLDAGGLFGICRREPFYQERLAALVQGSEAWRWQCIALDQGRRVREVASALAQLKGTVVAQERGGEGEGERGGVGVPFGDKGQRRGEGEGVFAASSPQPPDYVNLSFAPMTSSHQTAEPLTDPDRLARSAASQSPSGALNFTPTTN